MKITVIGGGTGASVILKGLKKYDNIDISCIVSMADDGGSTGKLREERGIPPVGDIRKCILALSDEDTDCYELRDENNHPKGNLILANEIEKNGLEKRIKEFQEIVHAKGNVIPVTLDNVRLMAELKNGEIITGETNIDIPKHDGNIKINKVYLKPSAKANPKAIDAILNSDSIIIGPGDLYTSIIPNLLVKGISEAILETRALKIYICNLMTKFGETNDFTVKDFHDKITEYLGEDCIDYLLYNTLEISEKMLEKYSLAKQYPVKLDDSDSRYVGGEFADENGFARHDSDKTVEKILELSEKKIKN